MRQKTCKSHHNVNNIFKKTKLDTYTRLEQNADLNYIILKIVSRVVGYKNTNKNSSVRGCEIVVPYSLVWFAMYINK